MSCGARRRSKASEDVRLSTSGSMVSFIRLPQRVMATSPRSIPLEAGIVRLRHLQARHRETVHGPHLERQTIDPDEPLGVRLVVDVLLPEGGKVLAVQAERAPAAERDDIPFVQLEAHAAAHRTLRVVDKRIERLAQRSEPQAAE